MAITYYIPDEDRVWDELRNRIQEDIESKKEQIIEEAMRKFKEEINNVAIKYSITIEETMCLKDNRVEMHVHCIKED